MVRVRAVVMARDDSSGGWLPLRGGGLSHVSVCRGRPAEGGTRRTQYLIRGERLRDQSTILECVLKPDLVYNKVNPIFHHWRLDNSKFGLTFQSPADADAFQRSLQAALAELGRAPRGTGTVSNPICSYPPQRLVRCPTHSQRLNTKQKSLRCAGHRPKSNGTELADTSPALDGLRVWRRRPPSLLLPPPRSRGRPGSPRATPGFTPLRLPADPTASSALRRGGGGGGGGGALGDRRAAPRPGPVGDQRLRRLPAGRSPADPRPGQTRRVRPLRQGRPGPRGAPPPPAPGPQDLPAGGPGGPVPRCVYCRDVLRGEEKGRGRCQDAPDPVGRCLRQLTCLWCAESLLYHCMSDSEGDYTDPCSCDPGHPQFCARWAALLALALAVPCMCCYLPLRACHWAARRCGCCGGRHKAAR
uniref:Sprouty related EVH1 domain containing 3 n=1 Tax=Ornithorhynchus anatinus TaxID=9258 RepID=A0A6I8N0H6_ORNAN